MNKTGAVLARISVALGGICILYCFLCVIVYRFALPGLWIWSAAGAAFVILGLWYFASGAAAVKIKASPVYRGLKCIFIAAAGVLFATFFAFEAMLVCEWRAGIENLSSGASDGEYVVVLGCAVRGDEPGEALRARIDSAYSYIGDAENVHVFACGGRSPEDSVGEGECIARELETMGISPDSISVEGDSTTTRENIENVCPLIPDDVHEVTLVSSNFHLLRAKFIAGRVFSSAGRGDITVKTVSAPTELLKLPCAAVREFAALVRGELFR